jgi:hypothetical protein
MSIRLGDYKKAFHYYALFLDENPQFNDNTGYVACFLTYLRLRSEDLAPAKIKSALKNMFDKSRWEKVIADFNNPKNIFNSYNLPDCGNCSRCPVSRHCYYKEWKKISSKIIQKINANRIEQTGLARVFQN